MEKSKNVKTILSMVTVTSAVLSSQVAADTIVVDASNSVPSNEQCQAGMKLEESKSTLETAQVAYDAISNQVDNQNNIVNQISDQVNQAQQHLGDAESKLVAAENLKAEATPNKIETVRQDISGLQQDVSSNQANVELKKGELAIIDSEIANQNDVISAAEKTLEDLSNQAINAKSNLDQAKMALDGTNLVAIQAEATTKANELKLAEQEKINSEQVLNNTIKENAKYQAELANAQSQVTASKTNLENAKAVELANMSKLNQALTLVDKNKEIVTNLQNSVQYQNKIILSPEYVDAMRRYSYDFLTSGNQAMAELAAMNAALLSKNSYVNNPLDDDTQLLDLNNLDLEIRNKLTLFAVDLINQIRQQFGTNPVVANVDAIEIANQTAYGYKIDNFSWNEKGHDTRAINAAVANYGLEYNDGENWYENLNSWGSSTSQMTFATLKRKIYDSIKVFMLNGYEWAHADTISGLQGDLTRFGVDFSSRDDAHSTHFIGISVNSMLAPGSTADPNDNLYQPTLEDQIANAQKEYDLSRGQLANAQSIEAESLAILQNAQLKYDDSLKLLESLSAPTLSVEQAQNNNDIAVANYQKALEANQLAQKNLATVTADEKTKINNLDLAQSLLDQANLKVDNQKLIIAKEEQILGDLIAKQKAKADELNVAFENLNLANKKVISAQNYLESLLHADSNLKDAETNLVIAKKDFEEKQNSLNNEKRILSNLSMSLEEARLKLEEAKKNYDYYLENARLCQLEHQKLEIESRGQSAIPVFDENGKLVNYVPMSQSASPLSTTTQSDYHQEIYTESKSLPRLSNQEHMLLTFAGLFTSMMGILGLRKKARK